MTVSPIIIDLEPPLSNLSKLTNNEIDNNNIMYMTVTPCPTISVSLPANIFATNITTTPIPTPCPDPCIASVDVTYTNTGDVIGTFEPAITIDGIRRALPSDTLDPSASITKTFQFQLTSGPHVICADPIGTTSCITINVISVTQASLDSRGMILMTVYLLLQGRKIKYLT